MKKAGMVKATVLLPGYFAGCSRFELEAYGENL